MQTVILTNQTASLLKKSDLNSRRSTETIANPARSRCLNSLRQPAKRSLTEGKVVAEDPVAAVVTSVSTSWARRNGCTSWPVGMPFV